MSDIQVDIANLQQFVWMIDQLISSFGVTGNNAVVPPTLLPDPTFHHPDIGQRQKKFNDAVDLYSSYEFYRSQLAGDPRQFASDPTSSSVAAFLSGLQHLSATAKDIYLNYQKANNEDQFSADQVKAELNAAPGQPATGTN
jgi:hypothetical protein